MKRIRLFILALFFAPSVLFAANDFQVAAQLLSAAKNADIQQVQNLVNNGANVNYTDATGLSIVCTALMNNDVRAAQILQMYGADASKCDQQIKAYNKKKPKKESGGLFGGLSSAQSMALAAAGAAVVVGGLFLLTDVFGSSKGGGGGGGGAQCQTNASCTCRNGAAGTCRSDGTCDCTGSGDGGTSGGGTQKFALPYGPAYFDIGGKVVYSETAYLNNLAYWSDEANAAPRRDFNYFRPLEQPTNNYFVDGITQSVQNYLLMMHGYSPLAHGYLGNATIRDSATYAPVKLSNSAGGGKPVSVALITANGVNPTGSAGRGGPGGGVSYADGAGAVANTYLVDKYLNYDNPIAGVSGAEKDGFDLSNSGTAMNPYASAYDSALAKIIAGWEAGGRAVGDFFGFVPNGRLAVYRTGGGRGMKNIASPGAPVGTVVDNNTNSKWDTGDTITIAGVPYKITLNDGIFSAQCDSTGFNCTTITWTIKGYIGRDGVLYVDSDSDGITDSGYSIAESGAVTLIKQLGDIDFKNFEAAYEARRTTDVDAIANASLIAESRSSGYLTMDGLKVLVTGLADKQAAYKAFVNEYYNKDTTDDASNTQGDYANKLFNGYNNASPLMVFSAGEFEYGLGTGKSLSVLDATFENYAPVLWNDNLRHLFMTVVAVAHSKGTSAATNIADYGNGTNDTKFGKISLSAWRDENGTTAAAALAALGSSATDTQKTAAIVAAQADDHVYVSRKCGSAGKGVGGVDPWCFAAAGATAEMATSAAAGAFASLKGAFNYMTNSQLFALMALTADGYLRAYSDAGVKFTTDTLTTYLKIKFALPTEYDEENLTGSDYLKAFAEVFGYGLIDLERATKPTSTVSYFNGDNIVSGSGNAYWRRAGNTIFSSSSALNLGGVSISAPFYDILESLDGALVLPRIWANEFSMGSTSSRALYMGDVLGEFKVQNSKSGDEIQIGNLSFSISMSEKAYVDNMGGLDNMQFGYSAGDLGFKAGYQRHFTDGASRFSGAANPILSLASNAVAGGAEYKIGDWSFGARAFSGAVTDESLLENDPTVSSRYEPAKLGLMQGAQSSVAWGNGKFGISASFGAAYESDTVLGTYTDGLLSMGSGDTTYIDTVATYRAGDDIDFSLRSTFAKTKADASGEFILGLSDLESNAFSAGANIGNWSFAVSQPLAVTRGRMQYAHAQYEVVEDADGKFDLIVKNTGIRDLDLSPRAREVRFSGAYRTQFGLHTHGAFGFIYRVNPNNTKDFGNESILMMKLSHKVGI
ncbi:MAG: ankyrin repeat domain-containing protein [Rickettsiales bacterium]|jgi:hypothetical protein|nr:ankyrin repeat domain-containing protein [Rickettsiales bacterium]